MFFILLLLLLKVIYLYSYCIEYFFTTKGIINYDYLLKYGIQIASKDNYFMNYGYWKTAETMQQANQELVQICLDLADVVGKEGLRILDIGCGYGEQDFLWLDKLHPSSHITAVDISDKQIQYAQEKAKEKGFEGRIDFRKADACSLPFKDNSYHTAFSIESAFHYPCRARFFKDIHHILMPDGTFLICDIMLQDNYTPSFIGSTFLKFFSDLLSIPSQNMICSTEWEDQIKKAGFEIVKSKDITNETFQPYYTYFFEQWFENMYMPKWLASPFKFFFHKYQPFCYRIVLCKKTSS